MSFENIQLSPYLIRELYRNNLIIEVENQTAITLQEESLISHLGKNEKNIVIIVNEKDSVFLHDNDLNLLLRIISPCKLSMADIAVVNINKTPVKIASLISEFRPVKTILFGATPADISLPMHFPHFQVQHYNNCDYVCSPSLAALAENVDLKKQLWLSLQKLFSL